MTIAEIIQIVIGGLSFFATILVSFLIYWLQRRHEIEMQKIEETHSKELLEEKARNFLIDNEAERDYLPWCIISSNINNHKQHHRKIYTNFNRCSFELQNEILKQAGFTVSLIKDKDDWVAKCFNDLEKDIDKYRLGEQKFLYDGAKYFHRGFERYKEQQATLENDRLFKRINPANTIIHSLFPDDLESLGSYIEEYFDYVLDKSQGKPIVDTVPYPPVDYVWNSQHLGNAKEDLVCYWVMELVENIVINIHNRFCGSYFESIICENSTDAQAETFEDKYYQALYWLYFTYIFNNSKKTP